MTHNGCASQHVQAVEGAEASAELEARAKADAGVGRGPVTPRRGARCPAAFAKESKGVTTGEVGTTEVATVVAEEAGAGIVHIEKGLQGVI